MEEAVHLRKLRPEKILSIRKVTLTFMKKVKAVTAATPLASILSHCNALSLGLQQRTRERATEASRAQLSYVGTHKLTTTMLFQTSPKIGK